MYGSPCIVGVFSFRLVNIMYFVLTYQKKKIMYFVGRTSHPPVVLFFIINISFISDKKKKKELKSLRILPYPFLYPIPIFDN